MLKRLFGVFTLSLAIIIPTNATAAEDYLVSVNQPQGLTWDSSELVPKQAQLTQVRFRIPRENPDKLIAQIVLKYPLPASTSIPDSKWILGIWLYAPNIWCSDSSNCDYIIEIGPDYNNGAYVYKHRKEINFSTRVKSDCATSWYLGKDDRGNSLVSFELSITCLGISSTFVSYAFSSYDNGITPRPWQFTPQGYVDNKFHSLAEKAYLTNGDKSGLGKVIGSPDFENFKTSVESARQVFDSMVNRYRALAVETQKKLDKKTEWKNFLKLEDQLFEIEDSLETYTFATNADKLKATVALQQLVNLKTKALQLQLTTLPQYQCYNEIKDLMKALSSSKSCPKGYKKIKT
jgi:hypothetical protein